MGEEVVWVRRWWSLTVVTVGADMRVSCRSSTWSVEFR